jgi:cytochrome c553
MTRIATNITWGGGLVLVLLLMASLGAGRSAQKAEAAANNGEANVKAQARIERGEYLVTVIGCDGCHTPLKMGPNGPEPDKSRLLSGHPEEYHVTAVATAPGGVWQNGLVGTPTSTAFSGPWGVSFAANLTPDRNTGLGIWTEEMFIKALRTGKHFGVSRPILPPMPWKSFSRLSDEDLQSMWAYLQSIPPVTNHVPDPIPPVETTF